MIRIRRDFDNPILRSDSYKVGHHGMLPLGTQFNHSHLMARTGPGDPATLFFGLQPILWQYLAGSIIAHDVIAEASDVIEQNMPHGVMDLAGWQRIAKVHRGRLPIEIRAVAEGSLVERGNVLLTVENTDPKLPGLSTYVESVLMKVWYPITVATRSHYLRQRLLPLVEQTGGHADMVDFMVHDFGYRGNATEEGAEIAAGAHLLSFKGTDTMVGLPWLSDWYGASLEGLGMSVQASQHETMTAEGRRGEYGIARRLVAANQNRVLSLVGDSYDYRAFVDAMIADRDLVARNHVRLVVRPDSPTDTEKTPADVVLWTLRRMKDKMRCELTPSGHVITPYGVLYGDGLEPDDIVEIATRAAGEGFAVGNNLVFGMGGGMHQKVNRDTYRFAIKSSAQFRDGEWHDVAKDPIDKTKTSLAGRLDLRHRALDGYRTVRIGDERRLGENDALRTVFRNGIVTKQYTIEDVRQI